MNVIFMGTPDFAVPSLEALIKHHNVMCVFSQPDKPVGRKQTLTAPPVKQLADENKITVYQPDSLKDEAVVDIFNTLNPDIIIVTAYGKILPKKILQAAKFGCINVHASVLPKYRGAAPIQWAVINGESETGVTIMQMDEGLDTGDILLVKKTPISEDETSQMLFERLSDIGAQALLQALEMIENGAVIPVKQADDGATYAEKITKALSPIDWNKSALEIHNKVRGLQTWPCAQTTYNGKTVKIHKTALSQKNGDGAGEILDSSSSLIVSCGDGKCLEIIELQLEGKKKMPAKTFLLGNNIDVGTFFGS